MTAIRLQYASLSELLSGSEAGSMLAERWLSTAERTAWRAMRSEARRDTWLAGRILAKRLLIGTAVVDASLSPARFALDTRSIRPGHSDRPHVLVGGVEIGAGVSIAHTERGVLVAVSRDPHRRPGVDLVADAAQAERLEWAFTPAERDWLARAAADRSPAARLWALKEALYKARQQGEGFAPGQIEVVPGELPCYGGLCAASTVRTLQSWRIDGHWAALAVVAAPAASTLPETTPPLTRAA